MKRITILGAGLSGISLSYFLKKLGVDSQIFEKERRAGGVCSSHIKDGFTFDVSGHLLHFRDKEVFSLVRSLLGDNLAELQRDARVYNFNSFIPYPFQVNLSSLPPAVYRDCLSEFKKVRNNGSGPKRPRNFLDWIYKNFGRGIAEHFMIPYNLKFWRTPLEELSHSWADRLVVTPSLDDIEDSANGRKRRFGYHSHFYYPKKGGIEELIKAFKRESNEVFPRHEAVEIDLKKRVVEFRNGSREKFDILVSTMPLPELGKIIKKIPKYIAPYFNKLRWVSIYNVNLGMDGNIMPGRHWIYFPHRDTSFFRVGFYHNFSSYLAPPGKSASYVEVSYSKERPIDKKGIAKDIESDLRKVGILNGSASICCDQINDIEYAYPVYDKHCESTRRAILKFLYDKDIISCGRYGSWRYFSMEDVILESKRVARSLTKNARNI
ncbi:MAG: FAD-dependent oxidoreductase [Candidatus Omnitrophica bacterium]|nr:FAD-dependent oxidoreductase [Candidatus Omnitrophota bacterium]